MDRTPYWLCVDGEWVRQQDALTVQNRAFLYGDGVFETMRTFGEDIVFVETHFERLTSSLALLDIPLHADLQGDGLRKLAARFIHKNKWYKGARLRLTVYRVGAGRYTPQSNESGFLLDGEPFDNEPFYPFVGTGKLLTAFSEMKKPLNKLASLKTTSSIFYVLAGKHAKTQGFDDCFIMNERDEIIETVNSNVFLVAGNQVIAPGTSNGALNGTMRKQVLNLLNDTNYNITERGINADDLQKADEVLLTNAVQGINWVKGYKERRYYHRFGAELSEKLNLKIVNRQF
ncbi:aminotransferase class IV [Salinivirga cyanobacteriivorans]